MASLPLITVADVSRTSAAWPPTAAVDIEMPEAAGSSHVNIEHALAGVEVRFVVLREMQAHQVVAIGHRKLVPQLRSTGGVVALRLI